MAGAHSVSLVPHLTFVRDMPILPFPCLLAVLVTTLTWPPDLDLSSSLSMFSSYFHLFGLSEVLLRIRWLAHVKLVVLFAAVG